ncbi:MAG: hypothetical protein DWQ04_08330 [Chloroflexi bacterium]|nr:MAG: hypothetical protein DWQ04_08330 [Chloroflexota bacterium]
MFECNSGKDHVLVSLKRPCSVLSSAVLNGGWVQASHLLNMKVQQNFLGEQKVFPTPEETLIEYGKGLGINGRFVGMMTSAKMSSFRRVTKEAQGVTIDVLVTAGVSNAKRAGETAEYRMMGERVTNAGTINLILITNAKLTPAAMTEAVMVVTEAKTAVLAQLGIISPQTGAIATGTGTDAIAIVSGHGSTQIRFCGKHTLFGELAAQAVIEAIMQSFNVQ